MNDPRYDLYSKENDLVIENNLEIKNAYKEIEKHKKEIAKLEELIRTWKNEIMLKKTTNRPPENNTFLKKLLDSEQPKPTKKTVVTTNNAYMMRTVHSFYNDRLFEGNSDGKLVYQTMEANEECGYTNTNLSLRYIPLEVIEEILHSYKVLNFGKIFKMIRPPRYELSSEVRVDDFCIVGIIHEMTPIKIKQNEFFERSKIDIDSNMVKQAKKENYTRNFNIVLTDLKNTLLVTVHGNKLIKQYYNSLKAGDVIMVEAPNVYRTTKGFAFSIDEAGGANQIMELGKCANYSRCRVDLKDGKKCSGFFDNRNHKCCEYHEEIDMDVKLSRRMELNSGYLGRRIGRQEKIHNVNNVAKKDLNFKSQKSFSRFHNSIDYDIAKDPVVDKRELARIEKSKKDNLRLLRKLQMKSDSANTNGIKKTITSNKDRRDMKKNDLVELLKKDLENKHK